MFQKLKNLIPRTNIPKSLKFDMATRNAKKTQRILQELDYDRFQKRLKNVKAGYIIPKSKETNSMADFFKRVIQKLTSYFEP